jgi:NOL1/NOP2/fmu family ribosome biogenesis protein
MKYNPNELKVLPQKHKIKILKKLNSQFGIEEIPGILIKKGKEKIFLYTGNLKKEELYDLDKATFIEAVGIYLAKEEGENVRLSIEGSQILKDQMTKNVIELTREESQTWMMGHEILKKSGFRGLVAMKYDEDMLGTGKASEEKITNFIPKSRRLRDKTILD